MPIAPQNLPLLTIDPSFTEIDPSTSNVARSRQPGGILSIPRPLPILAATPNDDKSSLLRELVVAALLTSPAWLTMLFLKLPPKRRFG